MTRTRLAAVMMVLLAVATGCAHRSTVAKAAPPAAQAKPVDVYELGPGDRLNIVTFDEDQLSGTFIVGSNGSISMPWVGDVPVSGKTEGEVRDAIVTRLKDGYILNPQVSVQVVQYRPFFILGEVNRPGQYPYVNGMTVREAVATAEGFTYRANTRRVYIKRRGQMGEIILPLRADTPIEPGDTIRIAERYF